MRLYDIKRPTGGKVPIIISSPHSGTHFPKDIADKFHSEMIARPDDTDWFIDKLYDFAPKLGITMITANYNRWVIDLNRSPKGKPLYNDGRVITSLVPTTNFNGAPLYMSNTPDAHDIEFRIKNYYNPYHAEIASLLQETVDTFGKVLLFDAHSIRKQVNGIRKEAFPDLILGDNDGTSASKLLIDVALKSLKTSNKEVSHNHPFKGGYITRSFSNPQNNIHALQLEMTKTNYMDDTETIYNEDRANNTRENLKYMFQQLINVM